MRGYRVTGLPGERLPGYRVRGYRVTGVRGYRVVREELPGERLPGYRVTVTHCRAVTIHKQRTSARQPAVATATPSR